MGSLGYTPEFSVVPFVLLEAAAAHVNPFGGFSSLGSSDEGAKGDKGRVPLMLTAQNECIKYKLFPGLSVFWRGLQILCGDNAKPVGGDS